MTTGEIIEFALAAAAVIVLAWLLWAILYPNFDPVDETSESYFNSLKEIVEKLEVGESDSFSFWAADQSVIYHIVYFGDEVKRDKFLSFGAMENNVCICSEEGDEVLCNYCMNLDLPAVKHGVGGVGWWTYNTKSDGGNLVTEITIMKESDRYVFT